MMAFEMCAPGVPVSGWTPGPNGTLAGVGFPMSSAAAVFDGTGPGRCT
jgi:hypothetical protein